MRRPTVKIARRNDGGGIELRVTADRRMRRYALGYSCQPAQWDDRTQRFTSRMEDATSKNRALSEVLLTVGRILDRMMSAGSWDWVTFDRHYRNAGDQHDLAGYLRTIEADQSRIGRIGNAFAYRYTANVVDRCMQCVHLSELSAEHLHRIDAMLRRDGAQDAGISYVMRTIRAAVNRAMRDGLLAAERYPFATRRSRGYDVGALKTKSSPRSLSQEEIDRIKGLDLSQYPRYAQAVRLFLWSYYCRGMAWVDMAHLRKSDIVGGRIYYRRKKTITKVDRVLSMPITPALAELLAAFGPVDGGWLLPILGKNQRTELQQRYRRLRQLDKTNTLLREVGEILGLSAPLTSYVARHTYATTLKRSNVPVAKISEALGHSSLITTEIYLAQFADHELDATDGLL